MTTATLGFDSQRASAVDLMRTWADEQPEGLISRRGVIDRLLDLRNLLAGPDLIGVDAVLIDVPGVTVVEASWWLEQVEWLLSFADAQFTGDPEPAEAS